MSKLSKNFLSILGYKANMDFHGIISTTMVHEPLSMILLKVTYFNVSVPHSAPFIKALYQFGSPTLYFLNQLYFSFPVWVPVLHIQDEISQMFYTVF
ncbi:hypothetical protein BpHYR1_048072 [Brachionus plicatilis]|uniref:Uncharacterized protein n=1 Tax=Brachionus plicatilis TaxID=10195 RepID=A0A3M7Q0G3_BRAPC|nr:hypothetical protein BpHYR1_048072 [Brachionus plicatilis]